MEIVVIVLAATIMICLLLLAIAVPIIFVAWLIANFIDWLMK